MAGTAGAADFTVQSGQTVNTTQTLSDPGDVGLIEAGGAIDVDGDNVRGVDAANTDQTVTNNGDITTSGTSGHGVWLSGDNAAFTNNGTITTSGDIANGVGSTATDARITNSGDIATSADNALGIAAGGVNTRVANGGHITTSGAGAIGILLSLGANARIDNSGAIATSGNQAYGIWSSGPDARIDNSGDITTTGNGAYGIRSSGANARITNSGDITATGGTYGISSTGANARIDNSGDIAISGNGGIGIVSNRADARITNGGDIMASGTNASGIWLLSSGATLTNSGTIISEQSYAIFVQGSEATLNLLAGSVIQGDIDFLDTATATLNIGPGLNTALTFIGRPATIDANGAPMVVLGARVAVVDPTGFSAQDEMLTDLTRAVAGAVDARLAAARFGYAPATGPVMAYAEADGLEVIHSGVQAGAQAMGFGHAAGLAGSQGGPGFWAAGIGSYRDQDADGADAGFDTSLGGLMVGYDAEVSGGTRVGGFIGASTSRFETDANSQEINADSYFGGVYGSYTGERYFLDLAVTGGVSQQSSDRSVANNLVIGGIEHAKADYDGVFVSPSATIGTSYAMGSGTLIPSFRARYAGLFLDGYEESGSAANLSVDDRDVNVFDFRAQLAYALATRPMGDGSLHAAFRFGADAVFADNDNVQAALLGTALNFDVSGDDTVRGFAGVDLSYLTDGGASYFLGAEAGYDSGDAFTLDVQGGLRIPL